MALNRDVDIRDQILPLAQSLHATPSSHVVVAGAGFSVAAGMESAWGVLTTLIARIAAQRGEALPERDGIDPGELAVAWYQETLGARATYESVLAQLGPTPTERQRILRGFFDADDSDRENGRKQPTAAHRALASLVRSGHVRIVVTLNFDTLIEQAIRETGLEPTVVNTSADIAGVAPLHTHDTLVVHLHGHYLLPSSMRNTIDELAAYDEVENAFLDRLFTDYGLIAVGWSGDHDPALRDALARTRCAHFSSYWVNLGALSEVADQLRTGRGITFVQSSADSAFQVLATAVDALQNTSARHPASLPVAVATAKQQLSSGRSPIGLHDLLNTEFTRIRTLPGLTEAALGTLEERAFPELFTRTVAEAQVATALVATTAMWGTPETDGWLVAEIERSARPPLVGGLVRILRLPYVPALMWSAASAVGAVAGGRWDLVRRLLRDTIIEFPGRDAAPAAGVLVPSELELQGGSLALFEMLEPTLLDQVGLTRAAWLDAWETVELVRLSIKLAERSKDILPTAVEQIGHLEPEAALEARARVVEELAKRVGGYTPHVRVRDSHVDEMYWPVTGMRLLQRLQRDGESHPMAQARVIADQTFAGELALEAVNVTLARWGSQRAWQAVTGQFGSIPSYLWLDTGEAPGTDT